jgi:2-methylisocitrate lyase-like PEP mutase family enzyme
MPPARETGYRLMAGRRRVGGVTEDRSQRAARFAALHDEGTFLLPNAWDVGSARILEAAGFAAIATTSAGVAFSYGRPDHDYDPGVRLDRDTMLGRVAEIAGGVGVPVSADLEEGYGQEPEAVAATIARACAAGAVGGNIEDYSGDRSHPLIDHELAADRIRAARAAADGFVLNGRTDALLAGRPLDEAIRRANAYLAAGADCAFVPGAADAITIGTLVREIEGPVNVVMGLTGNTLSLADLRDLGVRRVSVGGSIARAMYRHLIDAAQELAERGTFGYAAGQIPQDELNGIFGRRP